MRAVIYTRVSTEEQARKGFNLQEYIDKIRRFVEDIKEWEIAGEYIDAGISGKDIHRPQYERMMSCINDWDVLVTNKLDRVHRSLQHFSSMLNYVHKVERKFLSMAENLDSTTTMGRFAVDIIARIAQLESEMTGDRVRTSCEAKRKRGLWHGKVVEYFEYDPKTKTISVKDAIVYDIEEAHRKGASIRKIAGDFNIPRMKVHRTLKALEFIREHS